MRIYRVFRVGERISSTKWPKLASLLALIAISAMLFLSVGLAYKTDGRLIYGVSGSGAPRYRIWDHGNSSWSAAASNPTANTTINWVVNKAAPTRLENIAGILTSSGNTLYVQRWNGSTWTNEWNATTRISTRRSFDIAYEENSGRAMVVYSNSGNNNMTYRIWNGSSWTAAANVLGTAEAYNIHWVELVSRPNSNEIALIYTLNDGSGGQTLKAISWNGSSWETPSGNLETNLAFASTAGDSKSFDAAYGNSGNLLVCWGWNNTTNNQLAARYVTKPAGGAWGTVTNFPTWADEATVMNLAPEPGGDRIVAVSADSKTQDMQYGVWNGSSWTSMVANADTSLNNTGWTQMPVAAGWVSTGASPKAIVVYNDANSGAINWRSWNGSSWTNEADVLTTPSGFSNAIDIERQPGENKLMVTIEDSNGDLWTKTYDGTTWSDADKGTALETALSTTAYMPFDFAYDRYATTTAGNGADPSNKTVGPGASNVAIDAFTLQTNTGIDTVTGLTFTGNASFTSSNVANVRLYLDNGVTPNEWDASDTLIATGTISSTNAVFSGLNLNVTKTPAQYLIVVDIASNAASTSLSGNISAATATNAFIDQDTGSSTVTIDATPPGTVTGFSAADGQNGQSDLSWTNPTDADFAGIRILRRGDGTYPTGPNDPSATVVFEDFTAPIATSYTDTGLTNGATYNYAVFTRDATGNWNSTVTPGTTADTGKPGPTVTVGNAALAAGPIYQGQTNVAMQKLTFSTNFGTATLNSITINRTGTGSDSDVAPSGVKIYADTNGSGSFEPAADTLVGSGSLSGGSVTISGLAQTIGTTPSNYFVVLDIADGASTSSTIGTNLSSQSSIGVSGAYQIAPFTDYGSGTPLAINGDVVSVTNAAVATSAYQGQTNVVMQKLGLSANWGTASLTAIAVSKLGTIADAQVTAVKIYSDANGNGSIDSGDVQLGSGTFSSGSANISFAAQTITTSPKYFLVAYDFAVNASGTAGSRIASQTSMTVSSPDSVVAFSNYDSNVITVQPITVTFSGFSALAGSTVSQGQTNIAMMKFTAATDVGSVTWNGFKLDEYGSGTAPTNVAAVKLYRDANGNGTFDPGSDVNVPLSPTTFSGESTTFTIAGGETLTTTPKTFFIVYDLSNSSQTGVTVGALMADNTYVSLSAGAVTGISNYASGTPMIGGNLVSVSGRGTAPAIVSHLQKNAKMLELDLSTDYGTATWTGIKIEEYGTGRAVDNISSVKIWRDNGDGNFDPATDTPLSTSPATFTDETTNFTFPGETLTTTHRKYYITYDISSVPGTTVGALVSGPSAVTVSSPDSVSSFSTLSSGLSTITSFLQLTVTSQPVARGSVTVNPSAATGQDYVVMQALTMQTNVDSATVTALRIAEFGSGTAATNIANVYLYKETNGKAGFEGPESPGVAPDTLVPMTPATFPSGSEETTFTLSTPEVVTTSTATYYIVYTVKNTAAVGTTIGSRLADQSAIVVNSPATVAPFVNLSSNLLTVVSTPHAGFSSTTNLCQTCHSTHLAPDFSNETTLPAGNAAGFSTNRILNKAYLESPDAVNNYDHKTYNLLCEACHDGTGALTDIESDYNDGASNSAGHKTKNAGTLTTGWKAPPTGKQYNAGVKIPCMVCHDAHGSSKGNYKMLADGLYDYAVSTGWTDPNSNGKIDQGDEECLVCHAPAVNSTTPSSRTNVVLGISMKMPANHNVQQSCLGCHSKVHDLELAPDSCSSCHSEIYNRTTNAVAGLHSTHTITSDSGNLANASGTCTGMCHSNHLHSPVANNTWFNALAHSLPGSAPFVDYSATSPYGLCLSCHTSSQTGTTSGSPITTVAIPQANYNASAHQYTYNNHTYAWDSSVYQINCAKCHRDSDQTTTQSKYGPHASQYKKLSFSGVDLTNGYVEEGICYKCHATNTAKNPNGAAGKDFYNVVTMAANALAIDNIFTGKTYRHPTYDAAYQGRHLKMPINEGSADFAAPSNRHAECEDCHDVHSAKAGTHARGSNAASNSLAGAVGVQPTGGVWPNNTSQTTWVGQRNPTSWEQVNGIAYEWQLCLKCHSSYTTQPTNSTQYPWGANADAGISANQQTNQALEFNPNNPGYHGVVAPLPTSNWLYNKTTPQFVNGWTGSMTLNCSDCHKLEYTSTGPAGPHASNYNYILLAPWSTNTGNTGTNNDLCFQCHDRGTYGGGVNNAATASGFSDGSRNLHNYGGNVGQKHRVACVKCHSFIPHGWKRYKMLTTSGDGAPYRSSAGQSVIVTWGTSGNWRENYCNHSAQGPGCT